MYYKYYSNFKSLINYDKFNKFISLITEGIKTQFDKEIQNMELLYQGSIEGFDGFKFHDKCERIKYTLTLVVTETNFIFGVFMELDFEKYDPPAVGKKGFIFNLNDNLIYYSKTEFLIKGLRGHGPSINDVFSIRGSTGFSFGFRRNKYFEIKDYDLIFQKSFQLKDYLVFQVDI